MSLTGNYEAAFELSEGVVRDIFIEAHRSGEIPHEMLTSDTISGYATETVVKILQTGDAGNLDLSFDTPVANGIEMIIPLEIETIVMNSPAPSINPINFFAALEITAPVQGMPDADGNKELVLNLAGLPDNQVVVGMPPGEVVPVTDELIEDGLHKAYDDELIPHSVTYPVPVLGDVTIDVVDDDADPNRQIKFALDNGDHGTLTLPLLLHIGDGIEDTVLIHDVRLQRNGDMLTIQFGHVDETDVETTFIPAAYRPVLSMMVRTYPDYTVFLPGNDAIAEIIHAAAKQELDQWGADNNGRLHLYTPNAVENTPVEIVDFDVVVKPGFLGVLFNPMDGSNPNNVDNFIPAGKKFAQALAEPVVQRLIEDALQKKVLDENGCSGWPCKFDHEIEGHEVTLTSKPVFQLKSGHMQMNGSAEVEVDCWFDPDVDFEAKVDFYFDYNANGDKIIVPNVYDEDVDLDCLDWFLGFIIPIYGWIALIVVVTVIDSVGGEVVGEEANNVVQGSEYIAGEIHGVGGVTTDLDRIDVDPQGIILSGGTFVATARNALTIVPSGSGSPYSGMAASLITLQSAFHHASAHYEWQLDDGNSADGFQIFHEYIDDGIYIARLKTNIPIPTGVKTNHFARIRVLNVQPEVTAGADISAKEGEVIHFVGHFLDAEWPDTHVARWSWGDGSMDIGQVVETNEPPRAEGTVTGEHAYCDNGEYTVTLRVIDKDGGVGKDTLKVVVENVAPMVEAGEDVYAYPCTPITLVAHFTDPGWCDTHIGYWEFGDCSERLPATVHEINQAPAATGIAAATHVYERCGTYQALCTVIDDDGGQGQDTVAVRVIDIMNGDFEGGFRNLRLGTVANHWEAYMSLGISASNLAAWSSSGISVGLFRAEEFVVHSGQRSQCISLNGAFRAGIYQEVGANIGWDYQVKANYHLDERGGGTCFLGVDPTGGTDPESADVVWSQGNEQHDWASIVVRVTAAQRSITIFLQAESDENGGSAYFDDVALVPFPCPLEWCAPEPQPEEDIELCVDWEAETESRDLERVYSENGFTFQSYAPEPLRLVLWGVPRGQGKLVIPAKGLRVTLPFEADIAIAHVVFYAGKSIKMVGLDIEGNVVGEDTTPSVQREIHTLTISAGGIRSLEFSGGNNEGLLIDLCIYG